MTRFRSEQTYVSIVISGPIKAPNSIAFDKPSLLEIGITRRRGPLSESKKQ